MKEIKGRYQWSSCPDYWLLVEIYFNGYSNIVSSSLSARRLPSVLFRPQSSARFSEIFHSSRKLRWQFCPKISVDYVSDYNINATRCRRTSLLTMVGTFENLPFFILRCMSSSYTWYIMRLLYNASPHGVVSQHTPARMNITWQKIFEISFPESHGLWKYAWSPRMTSSVP